MAKRPCHCGQPAYSFCRPCIDEDKVTKLCAEHFYDGKCEEHSEDLQWIVKEALKEDE